MPAWEALARAFTDDTEVVVAKMDMEDNDMPHPAVPLASFPAIFFIDRDGNGAAARGREGCVLGPMNSAMCSSGGTRSSTS